MSNQPANNSFYVMAIQMLKRMTQDQLTKLMEDIDDKNTIDLIREEADVWLFENDIKEGKVKL